MKHHHNVESIKKAAAGRWSEILANVANIPADALDGEHHPCPKCGGKDRFRMIDQEEGSVYCNQCFSQKNGDGIAALMWFCGWNFTKTVEEVAKYLHTEPSGNGQVKGKSPDSTPSAQEPPNKKRQPLAAERQLLKQVRKHSAKRAERERIIRKWCKHKPPISPEAVEAFGGRLCYWSATGKQQLCLAFPGYDSNGVLRAILLYRADGKNFPAAGKLGVRKTHLLRGSKESWLISGTVADLKAAKTFVKCEGLTDAMALWSTGVPPGVVVITNACGAKSANPKNLDFSFSFGKKVAIIGDADTPGKEGAQLHATAFHGAGAKKIRVIRLPYEVVSVHGKDLRDWLAEGHDFEDFLALIKAAAEFQPPAGNKTSAKPGKGEVLAPSPPKFKPFPTGVLPPVVRDFVQKGAKAMGCDESYIVLPLLTALASAVGNTRRIRLKRIWTEPCVFWMVCVGQSGTLKSPAFDLALQALREVQSAAIREYKRQMELYAAEKTTYDAQLTEWKKGRTKEEPPPDEPKRPVAVRYICEDVTVEAVAVLLEEQPRGILVARDELSGWVNGFDAYKSCRGTDSAHWVALHGARLLIIDRKTGRRIIHVPRAAVSVCGGIQPKTLKAALAGRYQAKEGDQAMAKPSREHVDNGLAARLLFAMPPRLAKFWTEDDLPEEVERALETLFSRLLSLDFDPNQPEEPTPIDLRLTPTAHRAWVQFFTEHAQETSKMPSELASAWSKLEGYAARFALLIHLIRAASHDPTLLNPNAVDEQSIAVGVTLSQWFGDEASRVYGVIGADTESAEAREQRELIRIVRAHGGEITARELMHASHRYRKSAEAAEAALSELVTAKIATSRTTAPSKRGGRPKTVYTLTDDNAGNTTPKTPGNQEVVLPSPPKVSGEKKVNQPDDEITEWTG